MGKAKALGEVSSNFEIVSGKDGAQQASVGGGGGPVDGHLDG